MSRKKQYAALPYVIKGKRLEICLITSRDTGRWIIPKGWPQKGLAPHELAALEAFEEAGLKGKVAQSPIGRLRSVKKMDDGREIDCEITVFPLLVETQVADWPEKGQRRVAWVNQKKVAKFIEDERLLEVILGFDLGTAKRSKAA